MAGLLVMALAGCATTSGGQPLKAPKPTSQEIKAKVAAEILKLEEGDEAAAAVKKAKPTYDIPITLNQQVENWIAIFQGKKHKTFRRWLERSRRYTPMMRAILKDYGLPEDLVYLALIESGFNCRAYSWAHASGPWQFIRGTGRRYGLKINYWIDERRDPVKATHAAAKYLSELYAEFGSWYLAAAAYNAGEAKIRRALTRYRAEDYWEISHRKRRYLKRETKHYVPKMLAAAIIAKEPAKYGFTGLVYQKPLAFDQVTVDGGTSLAVAAKAAGVTKAQLVDLNPEIRRGVVPPNLAHYTLRLPKGTQARFQSAYAKLTPKQRKARPDIIVVRVEKGDTLGRIARTYGVRLRDLMALNSRLNPRALRIGQRVMVPPGRFRTTVRRHRVASTKRARRPKRAPASGRTRTIYTVRRGDTYWLIAQRYQINWRSIKRWNQRRSSRLKPGQKLVLYLSASHARRAAAPKRRKTFKGPADLPAGAIFYTVRRGDNLWLIARRFKVSTAQLKRWNRLGTHRLRIGQRLVVGFKSRRRPAKVASATRRSTATTTYTVRRGDNLWDIAQRFKVSTSQLRRWNNLRGSRLMPGDTLTVASADES